MSILELQVISPNYNITVPLERRIVYIRGDSGVGKTALVDTILREDSDDNIKIKCPANNIRVLNSRNDIEDIINIKDCLFIADDLLLSEKIEFTTKLPEYLAKNDNYIIIINRVDSDTSLPKSDEKVYIMKSDGVNHWLEKKKDFWFDIDLDDRDRIASEEIERH